MLESLGDVHHFTLPRDFIIGNGVLKQVGRVFVNYWRPDKTKVLVVTGPRIYRLLFDNLAESLGKSGFNVEVYKAEKATVSIAEDLEDIARRGGFDVIVGFGGGKSIDLAKYASKNLQADFVSIPTAASHDGITSPFASLKGFNKPISVRAKVPTLILLDAEIISKAPSRLNRAGMGDILGKWSAVLDWRLAHKLRNEYYGEYAASLALLSFKHVVSNGREIATWRPDGVRILLEALVSSGVAMCIAGSSRPASGSEHLFSHALDMVAKRPALHGEQVALGSIMMLYIHGKNWRRVRTVMKTVGLPTTAHELGVSDVEILEALTIAHKIRPERYTILGEKGLTWEAAEKIARVTGVIS